MKKFIAILLILSLTVVCFASCSKENTPENTTTAGNEDIPADAKPIATITMKDGGVIKMELYYNKAPNTVKNFISLANAGFYNGLTFHRVIAGFFIQGGCPLGNGLGGPGYCIKGEFAANGYKENDLSHDRGYVSMARKSKPMDSAGSQFFICVDDQPSLDGSYAVFGYVFEGMDVVDEIATCKTDSSDKPINDIVIKSITVNTNGVDFGEPETIPD